MPRSGSTLIDLALGQLPRHVAVGELFYLWTAGVERNLTCGCGVEFYDCPFWTEVGKRTFGGWASVDRNEIRRLRTRIDSTKALPSLVRPGRDNEFARDLDSYSRILTRLYAAILEVSGAEFVVDSSKRPSLAYVLEQAQNIDLRVAHVVRDPRGVAFSWQKSVRLPEGNTSKTHLPQWSPLKSSRRWVTVNGLIGRVARRVPSVTVRYEDFVLDPRRELTRVATLTGVADVPGALDFVTDAGLQPATHHTVQGGRVRFHEGPIALHADQQWQQDMPTGTRRLVSTATWPSRTRYDYH
jgi:Sulfotransferase family